VLSVVGLLSEHPNPTPEQIDEGISGNLCRCTGYASIRRAVKRSVELSASPRRGEGRQGGAPGAGSARPAASRGESPLNGEGRAVEGPSK
jgi:hypothetical protein